MFNNAQKISRSQLKHFFLLLLLKYDTTQLWILTFCGRVHEISILSFFLWVKWKIENSSSSTNWDCCYFIWGTVTLFSFYYAYDHKFLLLFVILFTNSMFAFKKRVSEWMEREILVYCKVRQFPLGFCLCFIVLGVWIVDGEEKKLNGSDWDDELEL